MFSLLGSLIMMVWNISPLLFVLIAGLIILSLSSGGQRRRPRQSSGSGSRSQAAYAHNKGQRGESMVAHELRNLGLSALHDVLLSDTRGFTQIDHLVLTPHGIAVIETKHYSGYIQGLETSDVWTQQLPSGMNTFQNPIRQNYRHCMAVRYALRGSCDKIPVFSIVVFNGKARLCATLQNCVTLPGGMKKAIAAAGDDAWVSPSQLNAAWHRLVGAAEEGKSTSLRERHLAEVCYPRGEQM